MRGVWSVGGGGHAVGREGTVLGCVWSYVVVLAAVGVVVVDCCVCCVD